MKCVINIGQVKHQIVSILKQRRRIKRIYVDFESCPRFCAYFRAISTCFQKKEANVNLKKNTNEGRISVFNISRFYIQFSVCIWDLCSVLLRLPDLVLLCDLFDDFSFNLNKAHTNHHHGLTSSVWNSCISTEANLITEL